MKTNQKKLLDGILRILWLLSGLAMVVVGVVALFNGHGVVGTLSKLIGICAIICGVVSIVVRIKMSNITGSDAHLMSVDSLILIVIGFLFINTRILNGLGKLMFIIIGIVMIFNAVESLVAAFNSRRGEEGWFAPRIVVAVLLLIAGIWVFSNAGRVFSDMAGLVVGIYFIVHGAGAVSDWIGRERYRRNFAYLDDEDDDL
ncbi:MAG: DUF308 domain-containing protein [Oscillospiraceae bacterium]